MESMLYPNDVIAVNKLKYRPKLPQSPFDIPLVNIGFYLNENARTRTTKYWWKYSRWNGITTVQQGDIFVFNSTWDHNFIMVKRCVGLPRDTLKIENGEIYKNSILFKSPKTVKNNCSFKVKNKIILHKIIDSLEIKGQINYNSKFSNQANANFSIQDLELLQKVK